jgi:DNA-binding LytR/AlgR family response regulator
METVKVILIDDEPLATDVIGSHLSKYSHYTILGKFTSALEADEFMRFSEEQPDVIFMDIEMPEVSGLEYMKTIESKGIPVIFVTAYPEYAVEAFNLEALDYLVKPVSLDRIRKTIERIDEFLRYKKNGVDNEMKVEGGHIFVKSDSKFVKLNYEDILYVEAFADYVKIFIKDSARIITLQTMKNMEATLPSDRFVRVHRSYIIALDKITALSGTEIVIGNKRIPIGKNYKDAFMGRLNQKDFLK